MRKTGRNACPMAKNALEHTHIWLTAVFQKTTGIFPDSTSRTRSSPIGYCKALFSSADCLLTLSPWVGRSKTYPTIITQSMAMQIQYLCRFSFPGRSQVGGTEAGGTGRKTTVTVLNMRKNRTFEVKKTSTLMFVSATVRLNIETNASTRHVVVSTPDGFSGMNVWIDKLGWELQFQ